MEPRRCLTVEPLSLPDGRAIPRWAYIWRFDPAAGDRASIEFRGRRYQVPSRCLAESPVPWPTREQLQQLDPCFSGGAPLAPVHRDEARFFTVYRCCHGNYFLEDIRGGIGMYGLWIFLGPLEEPTGATFTTLWETYHALPDEAVYYLGRGGPLGPAVKNV